MRPFSIRYRSDDVGDATDAVVDLIVIGAGATGAGVALDAASRGMSVVVLDMGDLASGTSSKSSKLIHGGLRYLEHYEFALVREGVVERQLLMRLAPHLVRPMDFVFPVWPDTPRRQILGLGLTTYDVFAGLRNIRRHERISAREAIALAPALENAGMEYAYLYGDCATDDARLVLAVLRTARRLGAVVLTYTEATGLLWGKPQELTPGTSRAAGTRGTPRLRRRRDSQAQPDERVMGVSVTDRLTGEEYEIRGRHIVNATGVWVDNLMGMADRDHRPAVQPSKGVHVTVPRERLPLTDAAVLLPSKQGDGRAMFAIPWGRQTILGTTDTEYDGNLGELSVSESDLDYVLAAGNAVFDVGLKPEDVVGAWAGVRPLLKPPDEGEDGSMSDLSRRHTIVEGAGGLLSITGGKLTTYRRMAEETVDLLVARDNLRARCRTERLPLGCTGAFDDVLAHTAAAGAVVGLSPDTSEMLAHQHGDAAPEVIGLVTENPGDAEALSPDAPHILAEVRYAAREEGAATLDDVLSRRTRIALRARDAGLPHARHAASVLAAEIGRDEDWAREQVYAYADAVRRERGVIPLPEPEPEQA